MAEGIGPSKHYRYMFTHKPPSHCSMMFEVFSFVCIMAVAALAGWLRGNVLVLSVVVAPLLAMLVLGWDV